MEKLLRKYFVGVMLALTYIGGIVAPISFVSFLLSSFFGGSSTTNMVLFYVFATSFPLFILCGVFYIVAKASDIYIERTEADKR